MLFEEQPYFWWCSEYSEVQKVDGYSTAFARGAPGCCPRPHSHTNATPAQRPLAAEARDWAAVTAGGVGAACKLSAFVEHGCSIAGGRACGRQQCWKLSLTTLPNADNVHNAVMVLSPY